MKYTFNYQLLRRGDQCLIKGDTLKLREGEKTGDHLIPGVGDYVKVLAHFGGEEPLAGRVKTRLFTYSNAVYPDRNTHHINMVLEEAEENVWGALIKA